MKNSVEFLNSLATGYAECGCDGPEGGLLLAISGGADSTALLHGTAELWPNCRGRVVVAHVDHQLRGNQSRADAEFVEATAESLGLQFLLLAGDVRSEQQTTSGGTEEVARRIRYRLLQEAARSMKLGSVVCGHHRDDQAETILHNIIRGTGLRGLAGMSSSRPLCDGIRLIRPLLNISGATAGAYLRYRQLPWRVDESNASAEFTRNRIRHDLMPFLRSEYNPQVAHSLRRLARHARDAEELSIQVAQRCLDDVVLELEPDVCRLDRTRLAVWPEPVVRATLRLIWDRQSWPHQAMTQSHWTDLGSSLQRADGIPDDCPGVQLSVTPTIVRIFRSD